VANKTQYSATIDPAIYCEPTAKFTRQDWIALAFAALDQAGLRPEEYDRVHAALPEKDRG
jgi:hypothetical protein